MVIDTNVLVSRYLSPAGSPARVFARWEQHAFTLVVSEPLLAEYQRVLLYERIAARHRMAPTEVAEVIEEFRGFAYVVEPQETVTVISADPPDNRVLECAIAGAAAYIVSGDGHLLELQEYRGVTILSPAAFLAVLSQERGGQP
ncbi:MAG: putative toxin-antitoxin system toxin component, PIN family [Chloroflexi bacterium]|nr:putative toxin-antitoxin system toxin component, PIN family [Chloroflexota bacterium]